MSSCYELTEVNMAIAKTLSGKRVAVLAADGFEYVELSVPRAALKLAGASVSIISLHDGKIRGMNLTEPTRTVRVDRTLDEAVAADYDALLLPGGFIGPDFLRQSHLARKLVRDFDLQNKPIASLCHGPWVLASAGLVAGRRLSSWPGIRDDLVNAGAVWRDEPLVRDRNWVTSRGPQDLQAFVPAMLELFRDPARAFTDGDTARLDQTSSPQADHPPRPAVAAARALPGPGLPTVAAMAFGTALGALAFRSSSH
jgi:protease I